MHTRHRQQAAAASNQTKESNTEPRKSLPAIAAIFFRFPPHILVKIRVCCCTTAARQTRTVFKWKRYYSFFAFFFSPFLFSLHNNSTSTASTMIEFRLNVTLRCLVLRMGNNLMNAVYVFYANSCHVCYYLFRYFTPTHSREIERGSKACFTTVSTHERRRHYFFIRILNFPFLFLSLHPCQWQPVSARSFIVYCQISKRNNRRVFFRVSTRVETEKLKANDEERTNSSIDGEFQIHVEGAFK